MKTLALSILVSIVCLSAVFGRQSFDYSSFDHLLQKYISDSGVDYKGLVKEKSVLLAFTNSMAEVSPDSKPDLFKTRDEKLAFWINAYNAFILKEIVDNYPVKSIKDINFIGVTVWLNSNLIGGENISFKSLEDDFIRERFKDPRIHFAINCASVSCPPIKNHVYKAETLSAQLDQSARDFINNPNNFKVDPENKTIHISAIFDWYKSDFMTWMKDVKKVEEPHILDFIALFYKGKVGEAWYSYTIDVNNYNWNLNETQK